MIWSAVRPPSRARSRSASRPFASPSMMRRSRRSPTGSAASSAARWSRRAAVSTPANRSSMRGERVVGEVALGVVLAAVPDEVERDLALLLGDRRQGHDLGRVDDAGVEARLDGLVQEHRVEHAARGGVQAERHVRDAEGRVDAGILRGEPADRLDRLDGVAPRLLLARRDREGEAVDDDVARPSGPTRRRACRRAATRCASCRRPCGPGPARRSSAR